MGKASRLKRERRRAKLERDAEEAYRSDEWRELGLVDFKGPQEGDPPHTEYIRLHPEKIPDPIPKAEREVWLRRKELMDYLIVYFEFWHRAAVKRAEWQQRLTDARQEPQP